MIFYLLRIVVVVCTSLVAMSLLRRRPHPRHYPRAESLILQPDVEAVVYRVDDRNLCVEWFVEADTVIIYGGRSPDTINYETPLVVTSEETSVTVRGGDVSERRCFALVFVGGDYDGTRVIVTEREVRLEGAVNFRDVGGYRTADGHYTRWGRVYRAGQLANLTAADQARLEQLGIRVVCDLRLPEEISEDPDKLPDTIDYQSHPVNSSDSRAKQVRNLLHYRHRMDDAMTDAYTRVLIDKNATVFAGVLRQLADEDNLPLAFHCTAGKDRAGLTTMLLLALLGVPDATIIADYTLSNRYFKVFEAFGEKAITPLKRFGFTIETMQPLFTANPRTLRATLNYVREMYGSVEQYLMQQGGLSADEISQIRENLLVDSAPPES